MKKRKKAVRVRAALKRKHRKARLRRTSGQCCYYK